MEVEGDVVIVRLHGRFELDHAVTFCRLAAELLEQHGRLFTISDFSDGWRFTPEARRYALQWGQTHKVNATALFGINKTAHAAITLLIRASALITRRKIPMTTVATEAEARAWVDEQRREWEAQRRAAGAKP
jgi:hypothetical protein